MKKRNACICAAAALLLMGAMFRPGCRILIGGVPLSGIYDLETAYTCSAAASRAAEEITRDTEAPPFRLVPIFCLRHTETDTEALYHTLLCSYNGVQQLYAVSYDDHPIGISATPLSAAILQREYFPHAEENMITAQTIYTYSGAENTLPELRQAMAYVLSETDAF